MHIWIIKEKWKKKKTIQKQLLNLLGVEKKFHFGKEWKLKQIISTWQLSHFSSYFLSAALTENQSPSKKNLHLSIRRNIYEGAWGQPSLSESEESSVKEEAREARARLCINTAQACVWSLIHVCVNQLKSIDLSCPQLAWGNVLYESSQINILVKN
jgi:hypothetical protein